MAAGLLWQRADFLQLPSKARFQDNEPRFMHRFSLDAFSPVRELLPSGAAACVVDLRPGDLHRIDLRFPGIGVPPALANAVPKRKLHYAAGRHCARLALAQLGVASEGGPSRGADNLPEWPAGIIGSISHADDVAWAAVARAREAIGIGVDVEPLMDAPRAARLERLICSPSELDLAATRGLARAEFLTLAFSVKESLYKCLFPLVRRFFGYRDARLIDLDPAHGRIAARLDIALNETFAAGSTFPGRFAMSDTHVFTSVCLTTEGAS